jgi:hypothetical protein
MIMSHIATNAIFQFFPNVFLMHDTIRRCRPSVLDYREPHFRPSLLWLPRGSRHVPAFEPLNED